MKRSDSKWCNILAWIYPLLLILPNIALAFTEPDPTLAKITDIILPLGVYYSLIGASQRVGRTILLTLPIAILAALQLVLLYLFGQSIIAIDMFLNILTTSVSEASELLCNIEIAVILVIILYIPPMGASIWFMIKHIRSSITARRKTLVAGLSLTSAGALLLASCYIFTDNYRIDRELFPANVISNIVQAIVRTNSTLKYKQQVANFDFDIKATHPDSISEVYVVIIGETSRAENWQLFGYERPTNPCLSQVDNLIAYPHTLSESNTTHKSVPLMLSHLTAETYGDSIYHIKGINAAFDQAGFATAFISNQQRNHSLIDFFGQQARYTKFIKDKIPNAYDTQLIDELNSYLGDCHDNKLFIVLHSYGSHFKYCERYSKEFQIFTPDANDRALLTNRRQLVNAYDNSIVSTDRFVADVIATVDSLHCPAAVIFTSDHGEDIFDDYRNRFLHASPTPTYHQLHVPLLIWTSEDYADAYPDKVSTLQRHIEDDITSSTSVYNTIISLAGLSTPYYDSSADLSSQDYRAPQRLFLNDYNEPVNLTDAGFKPIDFTQAHSHGIKTE